MADLSVREQVLLKLKEILSGDGTPAINVYREKLEQIDANLDLPCYDISLTGSSPADGEPAAHGEKAHNVKIRLCCAGAVTDSGSAVVDPLYLFAVRSILADDTLGGLVHSISEGESGWVYKPGGKDIIGLDIEFEAVIVTDRADPATARN